MCIRDRYLVRIGQIPAQMANMADISRKAAREGFVQPCVTLTTFEPTITGVVTTDSAKSRFYTPFTAPKPSTVSEAQWAELQGRTKALITGKINPSYQSWANVYRTELAGKCRQSVGVSALPQGKEYYAFLVRQQTTTDRTPEDIHQLGLREVARIRAEMETVSKKAGFPSREAMIADMRTNPKFLSLIHISEPT